MSLKSSYPQEDFTIKIRMRDNVWDDASPYELDMLDKFEKELNERIYKMFKIYLEHEKIKPSL